MLRTFRIACLCLLTACSGVGAEVDDSTLDAGAQDGSHPGHDGGSEPDAGHRVDGGHPVDGGTVNTVDDYCNYSYSGFNSDPSIMATSTVHWHCTSTTRTVTSNGIPDHAVGTFPNQNCPNTISSQSVSASMPLAPENTGSATNAGMGGVGYAFNGVKFDPGTAGTCSNTGSCTLLGNAGSWNIEALGQSSFNFGVDSSNAHVQPTGAYHYHGMPENILAKLNKGTTPTLVGYALDGFPIYARYGYSSPMDATSSVAVMRGSYQVKATPNANRPSTSTYPMGAFSQDYEYVEGSGDLDECNGRIDVTPEYPDGTYHYYITDTYPFIGRCLMGHYMGGMMMMPGGDGGMGNTCGNCSSNEVCCPTGAPCAGTCVPNCATSGRPCPNNMTCDTSSGLCHP